MTILTGIVLTVALGAVAQRGDVFEGFDERVSVVPRDDVALLPKDGIWRLDVVANDTGAIPGDGDRLLITAAPECGAAWRTDGAIAYAAAPRCKGEQRIGYCIADGDGCPEAFVTVTLSESADLAESETGLPVARLDDLAPASFAAVGQARASGFTLEAVRPADGVRTNGLAAMSAFGTLAPPAEDEVDEARTVPPGR
ncbi:MAG: hypothetical protein R6V44_06575 [Paracoccaceae bacterium]